MQIKQIQDSACISLRKCKTKGKKYTTGDLKSEDYLNKLVHLDEGFRVLKKIEAFHLVLKSAKQTCLP